MKIVLNSCYGGFSLSEEAVLKYAQKKGIKLVQNKEEYFKPFYKDEIKVENYFSEREIPRDDFDLIETVEELGEKANGVYAELRIVTIPDDVDWEIEEYDGKEWISEKHRTWY